jgi:GH43 family beta-xylosidase
VTLAIALALSAATAATAAARIAPAIHFKNPLVRPRTHTPMVCPDPDVVAAHRGGWRYFMVCTSALAPNAFPIYKSRDLVHWYRNGFVFPHHRQPWWALPSPKGAYWAPEIYRIENRWVVYFAARINNRAHPLPGVQLPGNTMVLGVAESTALKGPWHTRILHYRGQFNGVNTDQETYGGSIDPSVVRDPSTGQLYLFWAQQQSQIWDGELSPDGMILQPHINLALTVTENWECDARTRGCTIEGPEPIYHDGLFYLMYSGANTWDSTYAVGVAATPDPLDPARPFVKLDHPILRAGHGFIGPGHTSHPVRGPDGRMYILYHASRAVNPDHISSYRKLMLGRFSWSGNWPLINNGLAG